MNSNRNLSLPINSRLQWLWRLLLSIGQCPFHISSFFLSLLCIHMFSHPMSANTFSAPSYKPCYPHLIFDFVCDWHCVDHYLWLWSVLRWSLSLIVSRIVWNWDHCLLFITTTVAAIAILTDTADPCIDDGLSGGGLLSTTTATRSLIVSLMNPYWGDRSN